MSQAGISLLLVERDKRAQGWPSPAQDRHLRHLEMSCPLGLPALYKHGGWRRAGWHRCRHLTVQKLSGVNPTFCFYVPSPKRQE